jgi:phage FluMu gp28-like protein
MTAPVKESLASRILAVFQRGDICIPDHRPLIDDLHSMEKTVTQAGNVRYAAPRDAGSHADRWTAMALALHAAGNAPALTSFTFLKLPRTPTIAQQFREYYSPTGSAISSDWNPAFPSPRL